MAAERKPDCALFLSRPKGTSDALREDLLRPARRPARRQSGVEDRRCQLESGPGGLVRPRLSRRHRHLGRFPARRRDRYEVDVREEVREIEELLRRHSYIGDASVATSLYLAMAL